MGFIAGLSEGLGHTGDARGKVACTGIVIGAFEGEDMD
jgi:hypothetical protein